MRNGFTFKERHSSEFGVTVKTKSRPIRPAVKSFTMNLPYRDGEYDFSAANTDEREHYENRIFTVSISVTADDLALLQDKICALSLWLSGSGDLIFDDIPLSVWKARISDEILYMPEHGGKNAVIEVSFVTEPFSECTFGTEGPLLGDPLPLGSQIPLGMDERYTFTISGTETIDIVNFGDRPIRPVIEFEGSAGYVRMSLDDKTLVFTCEGDTAVDFKKQTVTDENGSVKVTGDYFEFPAGHNHLKIVCEPEEPLTVTASFKPEFMYTADFSEDIWG